jgi:tetratricopeptide (TPR) repeat protein
VVSFGRGDDAKPGAPNRARAAARALRSAFLWALALTTALPVCGQVGEGIRLEGRVRPEGGQVPPTGVKVRIETQYGEPVAEVPVNSEGVFEWGGLNREFYRLIATAEGFETSQQIIDLTHGITEVSVEVILVPARKAKGQVAPPALSDTQAPKKARKEYAKGTDALAAHRLDEAVTHLRNAVNAYPCYARAQTGLAIVLSEQQEIAAAEAAARKASACDPGFVDAYLQLGVILNRESKFAESETTLQEGIRQAPSEWQLYEQLAAAHYGEKQISKAEQDYQRVLALNPAPPAELRLKLADVYLEENHNDEAYAQMQEYLKAEPEGPVAAKIRKIMEKLRVAGTVQP